FLIDLNILRLLASSAKVSSSDVVLEVGGGTGSLTSLMAQAAAEVVSVEIDAQLHQLAREELSKYDNVTILLQDALRNKNNLDDRVLEAVTAKLAAGENRQFKLVANLPYSIATPIISNLLCTELTPVSMTVTIQKELGDRINAKPRTKDYSALSIWVQSQCEVEVVRILPPTCFWPQPKVHSAILHIVPKPELRAKVPDLPFFHSFVRAMFFHRRKYLRSVISSAYKSQIDKPAADGILNSMGLGQETRAEELNVETMIALCERVKAALNG
ncbi:MAG: 16S rRNA (adenine1518-N6/adenine1519-N6)-dimethyltransferase, partial [Pirellulaceae bacterium]